MRKDIVEHATLNHLINLLQLDVDSMEDNEQDYELMQVDLLEDIERSLHRKLSDEEVGKVMNDIKDYGVAKENEVLLIGIKTGMKLMKELAEI